MPYTIGGQYSQDQQRPAQIHQSVFQDPSWKWLIQQDYNVNRAWNADNANRRGTLAGGPTYQRFMDMGNEQAYAVFQPRPVLTTPVLPDEQQFYRRQLGAIEWDSINPYNTIDQVAEQWQQATGEDTFAPLKQAQDFLASKSIDLFGTGSTGAPARAADYALAFPIAIMNKLTGATSNPAHPLPSDDIYYRWHSDPRYWNTIAQATPAELDQLAKNAAGTLVDPVNNSYFVEQLRQQFEKDKAARLALTSGNDAVDYQAIKNATQFQAARNVGNASLFLGSGQGFTKIPLIGTQIANFIDPITEEERKLWAQMDPAERSRDLGKWGFVQAGTDFISAMPALSAANSLLVVARGGGVVASSIAKAYDWTLRGTGWVMSAGLTAAVTNWALEATVPGYSEFIGAEIDHARPVSGSSLAAIANTLGYFSTGTYGAYNIARVARRVVGVANEANLAVRTAAAADRSYAVPSPSMPETPLFNEGFGGSRMATSMAQAGWDPLMLQLSQKMVHLSMLMHIPIRPMIERANAVLRGEPSGLAEIDFLPPEERLAAINNELVHAYEGSHAATETMVRVLTNARKPAHVFQSDAARADLAWLKGNARTIEELQAAEFMSQYGPAFIKREAGAYTIPAMQSYVEASAKRVGADYTALSVPNSEQAWATAMRSAHQYEFHKVNGELAAALDAAGPDGRLPNERGKISVVSARHLFNDQAESSLALLRSDNLDAARAEVSRLIDHTIEVEDWFSNRWRPPEGSPRDRNLVNPETLATYIEDIQPTLLVRRGRVKPGGDTANLPLNALHEQMVKNGVWDLAFKPVDENGNFVSYVHTRSGQTVQSPWMDYPMGNADNIEMGNRGVLMAKYDAITRAFRTRRISEFQVGSLYRSLTSRFDFTASQIEAFHEGLLQTARRYNVQAQTLGTVHGLAGVGEAYKDAVKTLARNVFGEGPYRARDGSLVEVDWQKEIAQAYRQSMKLNLTAGLTSHMKSRFGSVGSTAAWFSDIGYVNLRFNLSPLFKAGEVIESPMFNAMRGVNPGGDPWAEALFFKSGYGDAYGTLAQELTYDQTLQGLGNASLRRRGVDPRTERQARGYAFNALRAPETMDQKLANAAREERVAAFHAHVAGGNAVFADGRHALEVELANLTDNVGNILPGMEDRAYEINGILDGTLNEQDIRNAHQVGPELPNDQWSTDPLTLTDRQGFTGPPIADPTLMPEDRGLWHVTTNVDSVHANGLLSRNEMFKRGIDPSTGLGGGGANVSLTTEWAHAEAIRERVMMATLAARDEITAADLVDTALNAYDRAGMSPEEAGAQLRAVLTNTFLKNATPAELKMIRNARTDQELTAAAAAILEPAKADKYHAGPDRGDRKYRFVQAFDASLKGVEPFVQDGAPDVMSVGLVGDSGSVKQTDPAQIGVVQVGVRKGAQWQSLGPDNFEVQMKPSDIWTLDQRILDQPLATEREGLLAQLRGTMRQDGETVIPGFQAYHDAIVQKLSELDASNQPPGELAPHDFRQATEYPNYPEAQWVPTQLMAPLREIDREVRPRLTIAPAEAATIRNSYNAAIKAYQEGKGWYPGTHPVTGKPWNAANPAEGIKMLRAERDQLVGTAKQRAGAYLDAFQQHVEQRIAEGKPAFSEPIILSYDPASNSAVVIDGNHRIALAARMGLDEVPVRVTVQQHRTRPEFAGAAPEKGYVPLPEQATLHAKLDGYIPASAKPSQIFSRRVDQVNQIEDIFGTPEHLQQTIDQLGSDAWHKPTPWDRVKGGASASFETLKNPTPLKQQQAERMTVETMRREFPILVRQALGKNSGFEQVMKSLGVPERDWLPFLMEDRQLAQNFHNSGSQADWDALIAHAGDANRAQFTELYASEEWGALTGLMAIAGRTAADDAFKTHFFNPYRNAVERSLNHPLLGVYPLSWAYKAAREWMKFLYDNRMFSELRLGMAPAVAMNAVVRAENIAFAQSNPQSLEQYTDVRGPFGSTLLIANLVLPGDWSTIPFPLSRTIRDGIRGNWSATTLGDNLASLGLVRDARLGLESATELRDFVWGPGQKAPKNGQVEPWRPHTTGVPTTPVTGSPFDPYR